MQRSEAPTLADEREKAPLPVPDVVRRGLELATVVNQLHREGRVHGAIEPALIRVTPVGLELAESVRGPGEVTSYTAPEQLRGELDPRSDIFAFGAVIYEIATGWKAFAGATDEELRTSILEKQPAPIASVLQAGASPAYAALDRLIASCLVKNPDQRRQRMQNVVVDLKLMAASVARSIPRVLPSVPAVPKAAPPITIPVRPSEPGSAEPMPSGIAGLKPPQPMPPSVPAPAPATGSAPPKPVGDQRTPNRVEEPAALQVPPASLPGRPVEDTPSGLLPQPRLPLPSGMPPAAADEARENETALAEEAANRPPATEDPGLAERKAAAILSQVGFGQEPGYMSEPPKKKLTEKLGFRAGEPPKGEKQPKPEREEEKPLSQQAGIEPPNLEIPRRKSNWTAFLKIAATLAIVALVALGILAASAYLRLPSFVSKPAAPIGSLRFSLPAPDKASYMSSPAISPDGRLLAFSAVNPEKKRLLWIRPLNSLRATPLEGTDDALAPFWSPDSKEIGFFAGKQLKKIAAAGTTPAVVLCQTEGVAGGGTWNRNGVIVFGRGFNDALYKVPAAGGTPQAVTRLDSSRGERAHLWPRFLPDGRHFVFYALGDQEDNNGVSIGSLDNKETRHLLSAETNAIYAEPAKRAGGYLLFARGRRLIAQPFDASSATLKGEPFTVADEITYLGFINLLPISASNNGLLAYQSIDAPKRQLTWFDRDGNQVGSLGDPAEYGQARISPNGKYVAVNRLTPDKDSADIWLFDLESNTSSQFTTEPTHEGAPVWSPDSRELVYFSNPNGHFDLYRKAISGGRQELLLATGEDKYPNDWSSDGRFLLFGSMGASTNSDIWLLPMKGEHKPSTYLQTVSTEGYAQFSPDGKWVAYQSDETGRAEVYVEPFPRVQGQSRRYQISNEGGGLPKWRADGRELYYITAGGKMMMVTVNAGAGFTTSAPHMLFQTRALPRTWNLFDVNQAGTRFLVNTPLEWASSSPITVVANWTEGFKAQ